MTRLAGKNVGRLAAAATLLVIAVFAVRSLSGDESQRVDSIGLDNLAEETSAPDAASGTPDVPTADQAGDEDEPIPLIAVGGSDESTATSTETQTEASAETQTETSTAAGTEAQAGTSKEDSSEPSAGASAGDGSTPNTPTTAPLNGTSANGTPATDAQSSDTSSGDTSANPTTTTATTSPPSTTAPGTAGPPAPPPSGDLASRLYPGWCRSGPLSAPGVSGGTTSVAPGQSIQAAIDATSGGVVELQAGVHTISTSLKLKSGVVLRGASRGAIIRTSSTMEQMVEIGGGFTGSKVGTLSDAKAFSRSITVSGGSLSPGLWLIGDPQAGQLVRVLSVTGNRANLELPLTSDFSGFAIAKQNDPINRAGLERVTLQPRHTVRDLVVIRSAFDVWVDNIETDGSGGQVRSAVYLRQAYRVGVYNNRFVTARELGDGGQGYGINIANNSSNSLITGNSLERFRHAILLHAGAAGNVVRDNTSQDPRHPNFVEGGPADVSFHGYASANLVMGNSVERIQINDAGTPGPHNAIVGNTLRVGPLTLDNGINHLTLLGNEMQGSVEALRAKTMPPVDAVSTAGNRSSARQYWTYGYDPFGRSGDTAYDRFGDGILDWGSGDDIYVDPGVRSLDICSL